MYDDRQPEGQRGKEANKAPHVLTAHDSGPPFLKTPSPPRHISFL